MGHRDTDSDSRFENSTDDTEDEKTNGDHCRSDSNRMTVIRYILCL